MERKTEAAELTDTGTEEGFDCNVEGAEHDGKSRQKISNVGQKMSWKKD